MLVGDEWKEKSRRERERDGASHLLVPRPAPVRRPSPRLLTPHTCGATQARRPHSWTCHPSFPHKHTEVRPLRGLSHGLLSVPTFISLSPRSSQRIFSCRSDPGCSTFSDETWHVWPPPTSPPVRVHVPTSPPIRVHVPQTLWLLWLNCVHLHPPIPCSYVKP